jgi:hypothetical protein
MRITLAALALLALSGCGSDMPVIEASEASTSESSLPVIALGESGHGKNVEVTVNSVEQRSEVGVYGMGPKLNAGETFVVVRYTLKNTGKEPLDTINQPNVELIDGDDQSYAKDREGEMVEAIKNQDNTGALNPKVSSKQTAVWRLDKASFDRATWRLKVPLDQTFDATMDKVAKWPMDANAPAPLIFALK